MKRSVIFICTGNVCRSPMAAALFAAEAIRHGDSGLYAPTSAGTWALDDQPATANAEAVMQARGLTLEGHRARTVTSEMLDEAELILVMTRHHYDSLGAEFPVARSKMHLMSELDGQQYDISDPFGSSREDYEVCSAELSRLIDRGYPRIKEWLALAPAKDPMLKGQ